jgi:hypothetical protein
MRKENLIFARCFSYALVNVWTLLGSFGIFSSLKKSTLVLLVALLFVCVVPDFMTFSQFIKIEMCAKLCSFGERFE